MPRALRAWDLVCLRANHCCVSRLTYYRPVTFQLNSTKATFYIAAGYVKHTVPEVCTIDARLLAMGSFVCDLHISQLPSWATVEIASSECFTHSMQSSVLLQSPQFTQAIKGRIKHMSESLGLQMRASLS